MERKKAQTIAKAVEHQNRIKFHAETHVTPYLSTPIDAFFAWVKGLIPPAKVATIKALFRYPVKTNEVAGIVFDKLSRVFDGRNPANNYQFLNSEQRDDWEYYRQEILGEPQVWQTKGWEFFKTEINSILIVDLARIQPIGERYPAPYFYWLPIRDVIDYRVDPITGIMEYIIFNQPNNEIAVIDNESYRVFSQNTNNELFELVNNPHDLGYCPAKFFWNEPLSLKEPDIKNHPLSKELSALDWFLFFHLSKKHLDIYGAYPIYWGYAQDCDYSTESGDHCDDGFMRDKKDNYLFDSYGLLCKCPKCSDKRLAGAGTFVEVPIPGKETDDTPDLREPIGSVNVDVSSLEYNVREQERLRAEIIDAVVGVSDDVINDQALNETQVDATFESQSTVLNRIKKGFEEAQNFVDSTVCRLRYGKTFVSAHINMGTEFYLSTPEQLRERYKMAKESGASESELDAMRTQIIETEYRNNPTQLQRMLILSELEPFWGYTRDEVMNLYKDNLIDEDQLRIKLNFTTFVRRFERENLNILEFGTAMPFYKKIETIIKKFTEYANEKKT